MQPHEYFQEEGNRMFNHRREGDVSTEGDVGIICPQAKEHQQPPEARWIVPLESSY